LKSHTLKQNANTAENNSQKHTIVKFIAVLNVEKKAIKKKQTKDGGNGITKTKTNYTKHN
jgi:hypothetical protein